jgi:hypothetical protein
MDESRRLKNGKSETRRVGGDEEGGEEEEGRRRRRRRRRRRASRAGISGLVRETHAFLLYAYRPTVRTRRRRRWRRSSKEGWEETSTTRSVRLSEADGRSSRNCRSPTLFSLAAARRRMK